MIHLYNNKSSKYAIQHTMREGRATIVVPIVMARADTVMNGARIPEDQFHPQSWNGVPVTVQHPESRFGSANDPDTLAKWAVGTIFNASYVDGVLKGEAWIDVTKANKVAPGLVDALNSGETMDVSTGYFASDVKSEGTLNGKAYTVEHHDLKPDHLALLPGVEGACNWADGCGVRANRRTTMKPRELLLALAKALKVNLSETADTTDRKAAVAALIANSKSPYTNEDAEALEKMSGDAFEATVAVYENDDAGKKPAPKDDSAVDGQPEPDDDDKAMAGKKNAASEKKEPKVMTQACGCGGKAHQMSAEEKEAVEFGKAQLAKHRVSLVEKIVANTVMKKDAVEKFSTADLESIANGLKVETASYAGRPTPETTKGNEDTKKMASVGVVAAIRNAKKKDAA